MRSRSSVVAPDRRPWPCSARRTVAQCLARAADLLGNRVDRRPLGSVLGLVVQDHPNRASTDLRGIWGNSLRHGSILSRVGASGKPGTVHLRHLATVFGLVPWRLATVLRLS